MLSQPQQYYDVTPLQVPGEPNQFQSWDGVVVYIDTDPHTGQVFPSLPIFKDGGIIYDPHIALPPLGLVR